MDYPTTSIVLIESVNDNHCHGELLKGAVRDFMSSPIFIKSFFRFINADCIAVVKQFGKKQNKI